MSRILAFTLFVASVAAQDALYLGPKDFNAAWRDLAARYDRATVVEIGRTGEGHDILALEIGLPPSPSPLDPEAPGLVRRAYGRSQAVLVVAGIEGERLVGSAVLLRVARKLLELPPGELDARLGGRRLFLVPRLAHDASVRNLELKPRRETRGNGRLQDRDRDGRREASEAPNDLDGDGLILQMRQVHGDGTLVVDADDERLLRAADASQGERGVYRLFPEALDGDGDGLFGEDAQDGVLLGRNFPHGFVEQDPTSGLFATSEPETKALVDYCLARPEIEVVLVYGAHDNMVKVPEAAGDEKRPALRVHADDRPLLEECARRRFTHVSRRIEQSVEPAGAFHDWAYFHWGRLALAANLYEVTEKAPKKDPPAEGVEPPPADPVQDEMEAARRDGFIAWHAFDHPRLGAVEIGGWRPLLRWNPQSAATLDRMADEEGAFIAELMTLLPAVTAEPPRVTKEAEGLYAVEVELRNDAWLPTATRHSLINRAGDPILVRLVKGEAEVLQGQVRPTTDRLVGRVGRVVHRWLVRGDAGERVVIEVAPPRRHHFIVEVTLP